eukprot:jgi/Chrzof1/3522/Cz12g28160.t1
MSSRLYYRFLRSQDIPALKEYEALGANNAIQSGGHTAPPTAVLHCQPLPPEVTVVAISLLGVLPEYQRSGLGSTLLKRVKSFARSKGAELLLLHMSPSNTAAAALYHKHGFIQVATMPGYYQHWHMNDGQQHQGQHLSAASSWSSTGDDDSGDAALYCLRLPAAAETGIDKSNAVYTRSSSAHAPCTAATTAADKPPPVPPSSQQCHSGLLSWLGEAAQAVVHDTSDSMSQVTKQPVHKTGNCEVTDLGNGERTRSVDGQVYLQEITDGAYVWFRERQQTQQLGLHPDCQQQQQQQQHWHQRQQQHWHQRQQQHRHQQQQQQRQLQNQNAEIIHRCQDIQDVTYVSIDAAEHIKGSCLQCSGSRWSHQLGKHSRGSTRSTGRLAYGRTTAMLPVLHACNRNSKLNIQQRPMIRLWPNPAKFLGQSRIAARHGNIACM